MPKKKKKTIIERLNGIADELYDLKLSDHEAWKKISSEIKSFQKDISEKDPVAKELLECLLRAVNEISQGACTDPVGIIDSSSEGLAALASYLGEKEGGEGRAVEACQALKGMLGEPPGDQEAERDSSSQQGVSCASLDDASQLLIELEPDDAEALAGLRDCLKTVQSEALETDFSKERISLALEEIDKLLEDTAPDREASFAQIGKFIEEAAAGRPSEESPSSREKVAAGEDQTEQTNYMPEDADSEMIGEFVAEGMDLVGSAEEALLSLETDPEDMDAVGTVFRAFHTVKGNAAFLDLNLVSEMAHHAEWLFSRVRDGEIRYGGGYADLALRALDMVKFLLQSVNDALSTGTLEKPEDYDVLMELLEHPERAEVSQGAEEGDKDSDSQSRIGDILAEEGVERDKIEEAASSQGDKPLGSVLVREKGVPVEKVGKGLRKQRESKAAAKSEVSSVRVPVGRLDRLIDAVGELVVAHSMVAQDRLVVDGSHPDLARKVNHTGKIVRELQNMGMSMRMVPLKGMFQKMSRQVRDLARKLGREVRLATEGEETEIDKNMVDLISDPLMHLVRNAVDHGIESPEEREKAGKPKYGKVMLRAYHAAGSVVVEIEDDGRGLDREKILAKAREKGLIKEDESLSNREIFNLIFEPGFSTTSQISDVSGRGVGMDVVKRNVESLRGQVEIRSEWQKWSLFKISLPLTLAIVDGMVVRVGGQRYVLPTLSVVRSVKAKEEEVSSVLRRGEMLSFEGRLVPIFRLADLFGIEDGLDDPTQGLSVVIESEENQAALLVEEIIGRQQIVIKSLGETMGHIPGISGGAIMPDGRVGLILDTGGVVRLANSRNGGEEGP